MAERPDILVRGLAFSFNAHPVLEDVEIEVQHGDAVCMVGPNGGGKTTLLKLILGLLRPTRGEVFLLGGRPEQTRGRVGYMPQHAHFDPRFPVSVMDVVLMGRLGQRGFGPYSRQDRAAALAALAEVGLGDLAGRPFSDISGGQRQRVLIARALSCTGELLVLDEPTTNIDPLMETGLLEILRRLNRRMTILMVTHDLGFVSSFFKRVICVNRRTVTHPTSELRGETIREIYGADICMIRHDRLGER